MGKNEPVIFDSVADLHRPETLGYSRRSKTKMALVDTGLYVLALPYAILVPYSWVALGFSGIALTVFTAVAGTIEVDSQVGEGSTFVVLLPLHAEEQVERDLGSALALDSSESVGGQPEA